MKTLTWVDTTLGELIRAAREDKGMSRTKLSEFTDISLNTLVKYEKAGEPDGKYPQIKKLIKICEVLEIDPRNAFDAIKTEDFNALPSPSVEEELTHNQKFGLRFTDHFRDGEGWKNLNSMIDVEKIDNHLLDIANRLSRIECTIENGPDQDDPSRPEISSNNSEAAATASTRPKKGKD